MKKSTITIIALILAGLVAAVIVVRADGPCTPRREHVEP